jgi:transposase InsO family protein
MIDIYSRYIVGVHVHHTEAGVLATDMMKQIFGVHGAPTVVHADRGTAMTSKSVASLLDDLSITRSHSRPHVSNDNPYSESWFKTCKYSPTFPDRFGSLAHARTFMAAFVAWSRYAGDPGVSDDEVLLTGGPSVQEACDVRSVSGPEPSTRGREGRLVRAPAA